MASLTLTPAGPGRALAAWSCAVRAEYYRVFLQRADTDSDPVNSEDSRGPEFTIKTADGGTE